MDQEKAQNFGLEHFKDEIEALRRVNRQLVALRSWAVNICLASLAFSVTTFVQVRLSGAMPYSWLAMISLVGFAFSSAAAFYMRLCHEFENLATDTLQVGSFMPKLVNLVENSGAPPEKSEQLKQVLGLITERQKKLQISEELNPFAELWRFVSTAIPFVIGLVSFLVYLFLYLFSAGS